MRDSTLCFPIKMSADGKITDICLAMKKRGFGAGRWNGVGGKVADKVQETVEEAMKRETREEIHIHVRRFSKVAELTFLFEEQQAWDQLVHVYFTTAWDNSPLESEEMKPQWFSTAKIPFDMMWPDDIFWLPKVLDQQLIRATFVFGKNDIILRSEVHSVETL